MESVFFKWVKFAIWNEWNKFFEWMKLCFRSEWNQVFEVTEISVLSILKKLLWIFEMSETFLYEQSNKDDSLETVKNIVMK